MASRQPHELSILDGRAMASHASGIPLDDIEGFALVVVRTDKSMRLIHDGGCLSVPANYLLNAVQMITDELADCQRGDQLP